jgi:hypothetical protein
VCLQNTSTCIDCLSVDSSSVLGDVASNGGLIEQLERIWKEAFVACSRDYSGICLERLKKTTINLSGEFLVTVCSVLPVCVRIFNAPSFCYSNLFPILEWNTAPVCLNTQHKFHSVRSRETE